jgi:regulatory protein
MQWSAQAPTRKSRTKSKHRVMRKGRPGSESGNAGFGSAGSGPAGSGRAGSESDAGGPLDGENSPVDAFDPFESFDAHDRAAGCAPSVPSGPRLGSRSGSRFSSHSADNPSDAAAPAEGETTYTRSRRQPGSRAPDSTSAASQRQRPTRSLKGRALGYLSRREHSRAELSRKLQPFVEEGDSLDTLLDSLEQEGWLSDSRFTESLVHRRASRLGANRIVGELKRQGVGSTLIEETAAQLRDTELARAYAVWQKKYGQLPETPAERAKQARFLISRGFSQTVVSKILKGLDEDWSAD